MGRSEGKNRLKGILLGEAGATLNTKSFQPAIRGPLKERIEELLKVFKHSQLLGRGKFYQDIIDDLSKIDPKKLLKDPLFLKILRQEARFLELDTEISLSEEELNKLAPAFISSFKDNLTPNIAREFLKSEDFASQEKTNLLGSYFNKLFSLKEDADMYDHFALNNILPLASGDAPSQRNIIQSLAYDIGSAKSENCHAEQVLFDLPLEEFYLYQSLEKEKISKRLEELFKSNENDLGAVNLNQIHAEIHKVRNNSALTAVLITSLFDSFDSKEATKVFHFSRGEKIYYLNKHLNNNSTSNNTSDLTEKIYKELGGGRRDIKALLKGKDLSSSQLYNLLEKTLMSGVRYNPSFYNYPDVFFEGIENL